MPCTLQSLEDDISKIARSPWFGGFCEALKASVGTGIWQLLYNHPDLNNHPALIPPEKAEDYSLYYLKDNLILASGETAVTVVLIDLLRYGYYCYVNSPGERSLILSKFPASFFYTFIPSFFWQLSVNSAQYLGGAWVDQEAGFYTEKNINTDPAVVLSASLVFLGMYSLLLCFLKYSFGKCCGQSEEQSKALPIMLPLFSGWGFYLSGPLSLPSLHSPAGERNVAGSMCMVFLFALAGALLAKCLPVFLDWARNADCSRVRGLFTQNRYALFSDSNSIRQPLIPQDSMAETGPSDGKAATYIV